MADDDPGVDKFDVLSAINSVNDSGALPDPLPAPEPAPEVVPAAVPPIGASRRPPLWTKHRHELAALLTAFVSVIWLSVGISTRAWTPGLLGAAFGLGALLIGALEVWREE
jgi:hypothetical protein